MSILVKKISLTEQIDQSEEQPIHSNHLNLVADIEVQCSIRIGTINLTIAELKQLKSGQLLAMEQKTNELIELLVKDKVIAKGELMSCDDNFALLIKEVAC
ncbi:hypothetical protein EP47_09240 [Legionella norrlandica]|uniref:Flagellar motor switch protein FliN n=1 Tax=Legionella norrlandica TaxID=1498499 RepID=A0A0A2SUA9_9GAMM|nr:FliM/FliN family flagellar motor switch protein [Legionella norrlandica]KGP63306.1 hypothetical protein EP47_09240 [Legionella norrlandica]